MNSSDSGGYPTGNREREFIFSEIDDERIKQDNKWGTAKTRYLPLTVWLVVLAEELGEVAQEILKHDINNLKKELIQVAAVAVAMIECLETSPYGIDVKDAG